MMNAMANPGSVWVQMRDLLAAALEQIESDPDGAKERPVAFAKYVGLYASMWGESAIVRWDDGLASVGLPTGSPKNAMTKLRHVEGDTFRRVRDDGELGEAFIFQVEDGRVVSYSVHGNYSMKVQ